MTKRFFFGQEKDNKHTPGVNLNDYEDCEVGEVSSEEEYILQGRMGVSFVDRKRKIFSKKKRVLLWTI